MTTGGPGCFAGNIIPANRIDPVGQAILNLMPPKSGSLLYQSVTDAFQTIPTAGTDGTVSQLVTRKYRDGSPVLTLDDPFLTKSGGVAVKRPVAVLHAKPDIRDGDVWKWSLDIQRELPRSIVETLHQSGRNKAVRNIAGVRLKYGDRREG